MLIRRPGLGMFTMVRSSVNEVPEGWRDRAKLLEQEQEEHRQRAAGLGG